jgi:hypothetical protein
VAADESGVSEREAAPAGTDVVVVVAGEVFWAGGTNSA